MAIVQGRETRVLTEENAGGPYLALLAARSRPDGGFAPADSPSPSRPDATAWTAIAIAVASPAKTTLVARARAHLSNVQRQDGSVCIRNSHPTAFWPTPLALLAWLRDATFQNQRDLAATFLLETTGIHYQKPATSPMGHDTSLRGWPWAAGTHSWVEPTSLSLLALTLEGFGDHERCGEAIRMLIDRQLPEGGWNYGNTTVYGNVLRPLACETGIALCGLAGHVEPSVVESSLAYLEHQLEEARTPLTLGWGILALSSWGRRPADSLERLLESLQRQEADSSYSTTELALLMLADSASNGLATALGNAGELPG